MTIAKETWQFVNTFAPWLSAFGTIAAVITALYLARRADKLRLQLRVGIRTMAVRGGVGDHGKEYVWVSITNLGRRKAHITHMFWKPVPWRKSGLIWIAPENQYSSKFPTTIDDGESANYVLSVEEFRERFGDRARELFAGFAGGIRLKTLRFCVSTSTGDTFYQRPETELRALLGEIANEQGATTQGGHKTPNHTIERDARKSSARPSL